MTVLKYGEVIKKVTWLWLLFWYFLKDLMYYHTLAKFHGLGLTVQDLWRGGGGFFRAPTLKLFNPLSASVALI